MDAKTWAEFVKNVAESLGVIVGGGGYFLYRTVRGSLTSNLSLSVNCARKTIPETGFDLLAVTDELSKGDRYSVELHDAKVRVSWPGREVTKPLVARTGERTGQNKSKRRAWTVASGLLPMRTRPLQPQRPKEAEPEGSNSTRSSSRPAGRSRSSFDAWREDFLVAVLRRDSERHCLHGGSGGARQKVVQPPLQPAPLDGGLVSRSQAASAVARLGHFGAGVC